MIILIELYLMIKGNDTLRGDGNNPDDNTNRTLFNDKRK